MLKLKIGWLGLLVLGYIGFSAWYGGNGAPITAAEGAKFIAHYEQAYGALSEQNYDFGSHVADLIAEDDGKEFYAVNLETLKTGADAARADRAYAEAIIPLLLARGSHPVVLSERSGLMLGTYGNEIDRVAIVRYRSLRDLLDMVLEERMIEGQVYKFASLEHTEVFVTRPVITFVQVRLIFAMLLIILGIAGLKLITVFSTRR